MTFDNHILALDMKTGNEVWNQKFAEAKDGYYATGAPIVANGVLISGVAGGESHDARIPGRVGSRDRQQILAAVHDPGAGRNRVRDLASKQ